MYLAFQILACVAVGLLLVRALTRHTPREKPQAEPGETRPTVTRVLLGGLLAGPVGALAGYAWRKKKKAGR